MNLLVSLGCSWTYGVGVCYSPGMSESEFNNTAWDPELAKTYSFRGLLSQQLDFKNINLSYGGSSNQAQFRLAENFFSSDVFEECKQLYDNIVVIWGITSVMRNETYLPRLDAQVSFNYSNDKIASMLGKSILTNHFSIENEVSLLADKIRFWDNFFDNHCVKNFWFDTFNHHNYPDNLLTENAYNKLKNNDWTSWNNFHQGNFETVPNRYWKFNNKKFNPTKRFIFNNQPKRDLASCLLLSHGISDGNNKYHQSNWEDDSLKIKKLAEFELVNPFSYHPTKLSHKILADKISAVIK